MGFILTLLLIAFGGFLFLAASPFIIYKAGKNYVNHMVNPYEKTVKSINKLEHPTKEFLSKFSKTTLFHSWRKNDKISIPTLSVLLTLLSPSERIYILKTMPKEKLLAVDDFLKKNKKVKPSIFDTASDEIRYLLTETVYEGTTDYETLLFYYYDELYEDIQFLLKERVNANHVIQHQIKQIIERSLILFPFFEKNKLFELSHKFKTLIQKDLKESLRLFSTIDSKQKIDNETELYAVLKTILKEIEEIEIKLQTTNEDELTKRMRILKNKFKVHIDEE